MTDTRPAMSGRTITANQDFGDDDKWTATDSGYPRLVGRGATHDEALADLARRADLMPGPLPAPVPDTGWVHVGDGRWSRNVRGLRGCVTSRGDSVAWEVWRVTDFVDPRLVASGGVKADGSGLSAVVVARGECDRHMAPPR